jgi:hypothetical protein
MRRGYTLGIINANSILNPSSNFWKLISTLQYIVAATLGIDSGAERVEKQRKASTRTEEMRKTRLRIFFKNGLG